MKKTITMIMILIAQIISSLINPEYTGIILMISIIGHIINGGQDGSNT